MDKKKIIFIIGICLLIFVLIICIVHYVSNKKLDSKSSDIVLEEESKTKDIDGVRYEDIKIYSESGEEVNLSASKTLSHLK